MLCFCVHKSGKLALAAPKRKAVVCIAVGRVTQSSFLSLFYLGCYVEINSVSTCKSPMLTSDCCCNYRSEETTVYFKKQNKSNPWSVTIKIHF